MNKRCDGLILLPRLRVENANAISGPLTWGFPSPTAFTGFTHALGRRFPHPEVTFDGVGVVCHAFDPQVYKPSKYHYRFSLARHPVGKDGAPTGTVEEGRAHLEVSLIIGVFGYLDEDDGAALARDLYKAALGMRLAGGSIRPVPGNDRKYQPAYQPLAKNLESDRKAFRYFRRRLLPGFALMSRQDLLIKHKEEMASRNPDATVFDALMDLVALHVNPENTGDAETGQKTPWRYTRAKQGWLVPLPVGYGAIAPLAEPGAIKSARDQTVPFRFVESLCSLGEWVSPHHLHDPHEFLWFHRADPEKGLYIVKQDNYSN